MISITPMNTTATLNNELNYYSLFCFIPSFSLSVVEYTLSQTASQGTTFTTHIRIIRNHLNNKKQYQRVRTVRTLPSCVETCVLLSGHTDNRNNGLQRIEKNRRHYRTRQHETLHTTEVSQQRTVYSLSRLENNYNMRLHT